MGPNRGLHISLSSSQEMYREGVARTSLSYQILVDYCLGPRYQQHRCVLDVVKHFNILTYWTQT